MSSKSDSPSKYPNVIRFDEDELPELTKWRVGGKYRLTLEVEQVSMSKGEDYDEGESQKPKTRASFKVVSVTPEGGNPLKDAKRPNMLASAMKKRI